MAENKTGGEMLIGLTAEKKLPKEVITEVSKVIFNNPDQSVCVLASNFSENQVVPERFPFHKLQKLQAMRSKEKIFSSLNVQTVTVSEKKAKTLGLI
jgi:hypothetical protein